MPSFEITHSTPSFPDSLEGLLIPHLNPADINFHNEVHPYIQTDHQLIPVFISEVEIIPTIRYVGELYQQGRVGGIATFGILDPDSTRDLGTSHLAIMGREYDDLPWIHLAVPDGYESLRDDWMPNNPLVEMYRKPIVLTHEPDTKTATITLGR